MDDDDDDDGLTQLIPTIPTINELFFAGRILLQTMKGLILYPPTPALQAVTRLWE